MKGTRYGWASANLTAALTTNAAIAFLTTPAQAAAPMAKTSAPGYYPDLNNACTSSANPAPQAALVTYAGFAEIMSR